jgi:hypothetical protein
VAIAPIGTALEEGKPSTAIILWGRFVFGIGLGVAVNGGSSLVWSEVLMFVLLGTREPSSKKGPDYLRVLHA